MHPFRLTLRMLVLIALPLFLMFLISDNVLSSQDTERAERNYQRAAAELRKVNGELARTEEKLRELTTSVEEVEREVRRHYRMVRPGEKLIIVKSGEEH